MNTEIDVKQVEAKLIQSITQYERILEYMRKLENEVGTASHQALTKSNETLVELQNSAAEFEQDLFLNLLALPDKSASLHVLMDTRQQLLQDILSLNQRIVTKTSQIKSFIAHEIKKLLSGRSAMNGYKQPHFNQGRIVNSTS